MHGCTIKSSLEIQQEEVLEVEGRDTRDIQIDNRKKVEITKENNYTFMIEAKHENILSIGSASFVRDRHNRFRCILTAAQCVTYREYGNTKLMEDIRLRVPMPHKYNIKQNLAQMGQYDHRYHILHINSEKITVYPKYFDNSQNVSNYDIAIITIPNSEEEMFNDYCTALILPHNRISNANDNFYFQLISDISVLGYPYDNEKSFDLYTSYTTNIDQISNRNGHGYSCLDYMNETSGGQSGGPVVCSVKSPNDDILKFCFAVHACGDLNAGTGIRISARIYNWIDAICTGSSSETESALIRPLITKVSELIDFMNGQEHTTVVWDKNDLFPVFLKLLCFSYWRVHYLKLIDLTIDMGQMNLLMQIFHSKPIAALCIKGSNSFETDEAFEHLVKCLPKTNIHCLKLQHCLIGDEGLEKLSKILYKTKIQQLDLYLNNISEEGIKKFCSILPFTQISNLNLAGNHIGVPGARILAKSLVNTNTKITCLDLEMNSIGVNGAKLLAKVLPKTRVTFLGLKANKIGDVGTAAIANVLPSTRIVALNLDCNHISVQGVAALTSVLPLTKIEELYLSENKLRAEGANVLTDILPQTRIETLFLNINQIGVDGIKALSAILSNTAVQNLSLTDNAIDDHAVDSLVEVLPTTKLRIWIYNIMI